MGERRAGRPAKRRRAPKSGARTSRPRHSAGGLRQMFASGRVLSAILFGISLWLLLLLLAGSRYKISAAEMVGAQRISAQQLSSRLAVAGRNVFRVDPKRLSAAIDGLPVVKAASVHLRLPNVLVLQVTERQPVIIWSTAQGQFLVDNEGVVMAPWRGETGLTTVVQRDGDAVAVGSVLDAKMVHSALTIRDALPAAGLGPVALTYSKEYGVVAESGGGWQAAFGDDELLSSKIDILRSLLAKNTKFTFVDLRFVDRPYYR